MSLVTNVDDIVRLKTGGKKLAEIRDRLLKELIPGAVPLQIDHLAKELIAKAGGSPSFMTVKDYKWATCISTNDGGVHGIPTTEPLNQGDIVGLDVGMLYEGWHTDTSWTKIVAKNSEFKASREIEDFLKTGESALKKAINEAKPGNRIGHISQAIQKTVEGAGYSVVRSLAGHGVGRQLHESPQIPGVLSHSIAKTPELVAGMVIAIEVIYNMGGPEIVYKNNDGWSLATADGSLSGLFEQTILVDTDGPIVLTQG